VVQHSPRFRVKGWISDEDFKAILEVARYLGRADGYALFEIDLDKARRKGLEPSDVLARLSSIPGIPRSDLEVLERILREELGGSVRVEYRPGGWIVVSSRVRLKEVLSDLPFQLIYDREIKAFKAKAYLYRDVVEHLRSKGLTIEDKIGLIDGGRLPRELEFKGQLRPYQEEALDKWLSSGGRGVIALPTGSGKTVIAIAAMAKLSLQSLIVVYTKEHIFQWVEAIRRFSDAGALVGAYYSEEKAIRPITVTTYQTAYRKLDVFAGRFPLVIFDEAHHLPADKFRAIAMGLPAPYRMGLSATVEREDGKHEEIFPIIGGVVYHTTPGRLTQEGYLAPFQIRRIPVELPPQLKREYQALRRRYQLLAGRRRFEEVLEAARKGDPSAIEALRVHSQMRALIQDNPAKVEAIVSIVKRELARGSKIIVFTQYRRQAEELARILGANIIHGEMDASRRKRELEEFKARESGVLVVTTVGDEGLDIPDANVGILASGTGSRRQFLQRLGRLLRPAPGKKAVLYEVVTAGTPEELQSRRRRGALY